MILQNKFQSNLILINLKQLDLLPETKKDPFVSVYKFLTEFMTIKYVNKKKKI